LKAPGTKRLKLKCKEPLPDFAFNFNLRRYITGGKDGKVNFFTQYMERVFTIDMAKVVETITDLQGKPLCCYDGKAPCVKAIFMVGIWHGGY